MTSSSPGERLLSTLNDDGTRRWLQPRKTVGPWFRRRQVVAYALIALFVALPRIRIGGRPAILIDLEARELSAFGMLFRPSDGLSLMLLGLTIVLSVFFVTALFGRVWCGWSCPQTVYLEYVFRPIERLILGRPARQAKLTRFHWRRFVLWAVYAALAFVLSNVFLAYFVGTDRLERWVFEAPTDHLGGFALVTSVAALVFFDFAYFREQMCILACPYGRLQSVLIDERSLIIGYNARRGEPRVQPKHYLPMVEETKTHGDCVDCNACVITCPTGIDIRDGLQMECIGCAQCVDACDAVMDKLQRPRNLIGYTSQRELAGEQRRVMGLRNFIYPALLGAVALAFVWSIGAKPAAEVTVLRTSGPAFVDLDGGRVAAQLQLRIENESDEPRAYTITLVGAPDATLQTIQPTWRSGPRRAITVPIAIEASVGSFKSGKRAVKLRVTDGHGFDRTVAATLLGPERGPR